MNLLRHEHITVDKKLMVLPEAFDCMFEDVAGVVVVEEGLLLVATEGDEVIMA